MWQYAGGASRTAGDRTHWSAVGPDDLLRPDGAGRPWAPPEADAPGPPGSPVATPPAPTPAPGGDAPVRLPAALRPMTFGAQLDGGYDAVRARPRDLLLLAAVFVVPVQLVVAFLNREALAEGGNLLDEAIFHAGASDADGSLLGPILGVGGSWLAHTLAAAAIAHTITAWYTGRHPSVGEALGVVRRRWLPLVGAWALVHLLELIGVLGLVVGSVAVMALLLPTVPAMVVEDLGPVRGVRRASELTRPRFGYVVGISLVSGALAWIIGHALGAVPQLIGVAIGPDAGWVLLGLGKIVADVVMISVSASTTVLVYLDLRIRQEGLDLEWAAAERLPT